MLASTHQTGPGRGNPPCRAKITPKSLWQLIISRPLLPKNSRNGPKLQTNERSRRHEYLTLEHLLLRSPNKEAYVIIKAAAAA